MTALLIVTALTFGAFDPHDAQPRDPIDEDARIGAVAGGAVGLVAFVGCVGLQVAHNGLPSSFAIHDAIDVVALGGVAYVVLFVLPMYATYAAIGGGLVGAGIGAGVGALVDVVAPPE